MFNQRGLGYVPDLPKVEDYSDTHPEVSKLLSAANIGSGAAGGAVAALPAVVDLRPWFSPVEDQGYLGSCTANAAAGLLEYNERRARGRFVDASRLFLYKAERDLLGWTGDTGAYLRTAMEALVLFGAPPEHYWPYDGNPPASNPHYNVEPPAFCYAFGSAYQALTYFRHDPAGTPAATVLNNIRTYVAAGIPAMFGFPVYPEYDSPLPGGLIGYPVAGQTSRGGHANVVAGYDDNLMIGGDKGALLVRNSWGPAWGVGGYGWLSYKYVTSALANDFWSMITAKWLDTGNFG
ncbi:MAG TPA: C1 family peptidase [Rhizomicrobium sp.]|nr:C1 family peptidase [Rhizomicrobium sp.]